MIGRQLLIGVVLTGALCSAGAQETAEPETPAAVAPDTAEPQALDSVAVVPLREEAPEPQAAEASATTQLEEIVVTATKRAAPVRNIPATINVLSGEDLEREGVQSIDQIVQQVPGVNLTDDGTGGSAKRVTIRGVSTGFGVNPTTGTLFGDLPFSDPFAPKVGLDPNPFDMETVEVLKGPQGTLFGGTGLNGLIRYVPEAPHLDEFRVKYYTQLMSYPGVGGSAWNYGGAVNAPFADHTAALRVVGFRRESPGYVDDTRRDASDVNTLEQYGLRGALTWMPAEYWKVSLMAATQHTEEADIPYTDNYDGDLSHNDASRPSPAEYSYSLATLGIEREFEWGTLLSQTSYFEKKFDIFVDASRAIGGVLPLLGAADYNRSDGFTQEIRAVSAPGDSPWKWLAGAFYYQLDLYDCANVAAAGGLPELAIRIPALLTGILPNVCPGNAEELRGQLNIANLIGDVQLRETALFGELSRSLGEDWEATLGARVYRSEAGGIVTTAGAIYATQNNLMEVSRENNVREQGVSPKVSIVYSPTDELRSYVTVSRGFRFGGPQIGASTPNTDVPEIYKSDSLWNYEVGVRSDWLDRTLRIDLSAYHLDWTDPQVFQKQDLVAGIALGNFIDNVGGARGNGVELSLRYLFPFAPGLSLDAAGAWNDTRTTEAFDSSTGVTVPKDSPWPLSPRWQTATTLAYLLPIMDWQLGASARHIYMGKACNTIECTAQVFGYHQLDLNVFVAPIVDSWWPQFSVALTNVTDERGYGNITTNPEPANDSITYIAPRTVVLRLSGSF
ncbi:MAG TPA: TonB-dependent receptor [Fontimonas sp.]